MSDTHTNQYMSTPESTQTDAVEVQPTDNVDTIDDAETVGVGTVTQPGTLTEDDIERPDFEEVTRSCYSSQKEARSAFHNHKINPSRTRAYSKMYKRFSQPAYYHYANSLHCYQWPNGAGFMESTNRQGRGGHSFRCQDDSSIPINVDELYTFLDSESTICLSETVTCHRDSETRNAVIEFEDGSFVVILHDSSAQWHAGNKAGLLVEPDEPHYAHVYQCIEREALEDLSDLVAPDIVLADGREVIDSSTYRRRSSSTAHDADGGYGDEDSLGEYIIRQGEWYFIPRPHLSVHESQIRKPLMGDYEDRQSNTLGNHVPRDLVVIEDEDEGWFSTDTEAGTYVRGTVRHRRNEHSMVNLYEMWHQAVENTEEMYVFGGHTRAQRWD